MWTFDASPVDWPSARKVFLFFFFLLPFIFEKKREKRNIPYNQRTYKNLNIHSSILPFAPLLGRLVGLSVGWSLTRSFARSFIHSLTLAPANCFISWNKFSCECSCSQFSVQDSMERWIKRRIYNKLKYSPFPQFSQLCPLASYFPTHGVLCVDVILDSRINETLNSTGYRTPSLVRAISIPI